MRKSEPREPQLKFGVSKALTGRWKGSSLEKANGHEGEDKDGLYQHMDVWVGSRPDIEAKGKQIKIAISLGERAVLEAQVWLALRTRLT